MDHDQNPPETPASEQPPGVRPVAIGGRGTDEDLFDGMPGDEPAIPADIAPPPVYIHDERPVIEDARGELLVGLAAALLAAATFLPWYRSFGEFDISGWASGTWGPAVFFLGLAGVVIVGARRFGVALAFPVSYSLLLEGIGWVSVLGLLAKRFWPPENFSVVGLSANPLEMGFWVALFAAVAVAMLASRLSRNAPIVVLPGWFRSKAGKLGAGILALAIAGGAAFGVMNDPGEALARARGDRVGSSFDPGQTPEVEQGLPSCMKDLGFATPSGVTATQGFSAANDVCTASFTSKTPLAKLASDMLAAMKSAGWKVQAVKDGTTETTRIFTVTEPRCGNVSILDDTTKNTRAIQVLLGDEQLCAAIEAQRNQTPN